MRHDGWTDAEVATLRRLLADGLSAAAIGKRMGKTRNTILGKKYRLGLCASTTPGRITRYARAKVEVGDGV